MPEQLDWPSEGGADQSGGLAAIYTGGEEGECSGHTGEWARSPIEPKIEGAVGCEQSYWWDTTELIPGPILELAPSPIYC